MLARYQSLFRPWHLLVLLMAALVPALAQAQIQIPNTPFSLAQDDYFLNVLLKGLLGIQINATSGGPQNVITSTGSMGDVMRVFNLGVAFFGGLLVFFIVIVGILQTGRDGEFLGRQWSSMWVPVRFALGSLLLLPLTSAGYSLVQALVLWILAQGVGFADTVWSATLERIMKNTPASLSAQMPLRSVAESVALSNICSQLVNQTMKTLGPVTTSTSAAIPISLGTPELRVTKLYGVAGSPNYAKLCGGFEISMTDTMAGVINSAFGSSFNDAQQLRKAISQAHVAGLAQMDADLQAPARAYVEAMFQPGASVSAAETNLLNGIQAAQESYASLVSAAVAAGLQNNFLTSDAQKKIAEEMAKKGFAVAGTWYIQVTKTYDAARTAVQIMPTRFDIDYKMLDSDPSAQNMMPILNSARSALSQAAATATPVTTGGLVRISSEQDDVLKSIRADSNWASSLFSTIGGWVFKVISVGPNSTDPFNRTTTSNSALLELKDRGDYVLDMVGVLVATQITLSGVGEGAGRSLLNTVGIGGAIAGAASTVGTYLTMGVMALWALGMALAVWVPMMPYILWTGAVVGLLILVIESLVASVLWAVMIMHPEGEGIAGTHAKQGVMILLNLFTRPALMVVGLAFSIFLIDPVVVFVNDTFGYAVTSLQSKSITGFFSAIGFLAVYVGLILVVVDKAFSLIHVVPDRVLRWIGSSEQLGETEFSGRANQIMASSNAATNAMIARGPATRVSPAAPPAGRRGGGGEAPPPSVDAGKG